MNDNKIDRLEYRRKRRIRNQVLAIITVVVIAVVLIGGSAALVYHGGRIFEEKQDVESTDEVTEEVVDTEAENEEVIDEELEEQDELIEEENEEQKLFEELVASHISEMTLEEKVAGMFVVEPEAITGVSAAINAGPTTKEALVKRPVGGMIYFSKNIKDEAQLKELIENTVSFCKYPMFIGVDEEGGSVSRLANSSLEIEKVDSMQAIGEAGDVAKAKTAGEQIGTYLSQYGFNLNFAPVVDVPTVEDNTLSDRAFSSDVSVVEAMGSEFILGMQSTGVSATAKHFPGIGSTTDDTHDGAAVIDKSLDEMREVEFKPFIKAIESGVDFIMVSHASAPQVVGDDTPSDLSAMMVNEVLRNELGFQGVVITDALNMAAVTDKYDSNEAAVMAIQAGVDVLLMPEDFETAYEGILEAINNGKITEERINESLTRIYRVKFKSAIGE